MQKLFGFVAPVLAVAAVMGLLRWHSQKQQDAIDSAPTLEAVYAPPVERVETHVLESGQTLSDVLNRARIVGPEQIEMLFSLREYVNPRRLVEGVEVTVRRWAQTDAARAIEVRVNPDTTVRLSRAELGWRGDFIITPVSVDTVFTQGRIDPGTTLFQAIVYSDNDEVPIRDRAALVYRLADIYEFKLDFTREIQPGDTYRLVYEREARPDGSARSQRILVAEIVSQNQTYPALWYSGGGDVQGYYDREGKPLASGFSRYPVNFRVTSSFSRRRYHPVLGIYRAHLGTDFGAPAGTAVEATADGTVTFAGRSGGYGNMVTIRHVSGYETRYAHLRSFARGIRRGVHVRQKQVIGYVGATGLATGPHLHYELRKGGRAVDARRERLPTAPPLAGTHSEKFKVVQGSLLALLDREAQQYLARLAARMAQLANP
jgi:murein DD-endopeptidase MepM/ murein hydrolase activator NlpD